jgi:hypothetical protein
MTNETWKRLLGSLRGSSREWGGGQRTENDFARIQNAYKLVSRRFVLVYLEELW